MPEPPAALRHLPTLFPRFRFSTQRITNGRGDLLGYELQPLPGGGSDADPAALSGHVLVHALLDARWWATRPGAQFFYSLDRSSLLRPEAEALPSRLGGVLLPPLLRLDPLLRRRLEWLVACGQQLVLDHVSRMDDPRWALAPHVRMVRLDLPEEGAAALDPLIVRAHHLGLRVAVCGIEREEHRAWLRRRGVEFFQGPLVQAPQRHEVSGLPGCHRITLHHVVKMLQRHAPCERLAELAQEDPALMLRLFLLHALLQPQTADGPAPQVRTLPDLLQSMPRASLHGWACLLLATATGRHGATWSRTVQDQMQRFRQAVAISAGPASPDQRVFALYRRMCLARPLAHGSDELRAAP